MNDLKHIHAVKAGEKSFVAGIVSAAVKHSVINKLSIVTVEQFSEKASMPVWIFLLAWILVVGTTVAVISSLALYVARTNPAVELKKE